MALDYYWPVGDSSERGSLSNANVDGWVSGADDVDGWGNGIVFSDLS